MSLRDELLTRLTTGMDLNDRGTQRFRSDISRVLDSRFSDEETLWKARAEIERRHKVATQYEKDAALQRDEAARLAAAIAAVVETPGSVNDGD